MNGRRLFWTLMILLVVSIMSVAVFARPPMSVCCASPDSCVAFETCFSPGYHGDIDGDGDGDYCGGGEWWDCGADQETQGCGANEICLDHDCVVIKDILCQSCTKWFECASGICDEGKCKETLDETGSGWCGDGKDNDCDGKVDCGTIDFLADEGCGCCGSENNECCPGDNCDSGLYCDSTHCCETGRYWDPNAGGQGVGGCVDAFECGIGGTQVSDGQCYADISDFVGWYGDPDCYQGAQGCCYTFQNNNWDYYYEPITTY